MWRWFTQMFVYNKNNERFLMPTLFWCKEDTIVVEDWLRFTRRIHHLPVSTHGQRHIHGI